MSGCGPDARSVKVCLNGGTISGGKHGIQDRQRFDGGILAFRLREARQIAACPEFLHDFARFPFYCVYFAVVPQDRNAYHVT